VHSYEEEALDTGALWSRLRQDIALIPNPEGANGAAAFGHITGGYNHSVSVSLSLSLSLAHESKHPNRDGEPTQVRLAVLWLPLQRGVLGRYVCSIPRQLFVEGAWQGTCACHLRVSNVDVVVAGVAASAYNVSATLSRSIAT